ncbi:unnamed protein product, partial [Gulo gulo]
GRSHVSSERSRAPSGRSHVPLGRSHILSGRSYGQSGGYRRHSPTERFKTSPKTESDFDRFLVMKRRNEYFQKQTRQRHDQMDKNRMMSPEDGRSGRENDRRPERSTRRAKTSLLTSRKTSTKSSRQQARGKYLNLNFRATGNQTKLSLNERFSKLKMKKIPESIISCEDQKALSS